LSIARRSAIMTRMNCAIFYRVNGGALCVVTTDDGSPREFPHHDDAIHYAEHSVLFESDDVDYQIVALEEL
jgi:hypothetical protein